MTRRSAVGHIARHMADFDLIIRGGTVVTPEGFKAADLGVRDGRFAAIEPPGVLVPASDATPELDAIGLHVLPGVIDSHVHFRSPGLEKEEDWLTGTRSAVFGGVTTVLDMPNTIPPTDTSERARAKLAQAQASACCDFGVFGLLGTSLESVQELAGSGLIVGFKAFMGPTTGGLLAPTNGDLLRALEAARDAGLRVAFHAEDGAALEAASVDRSRTDALAHLDARPAAAEVAAIDLIGAALVATGSRGHVLHLSSAQGLAAVERWRGRGADVTFEVTPHHLLLERDVYQRFGGIAKVNPPIRGGSHAPTLLTALVDGRIDCLASDHAPHVETDKRKVSIWDVPPGFAGVETLLPLMLTEVAGGRLSLERLVGATSEAPAKAWGLWPRKGAIEIGSDADLTIVDLDAAGVVRAADLHGKNNLSPFEGRATRGAAVATVVRGRIVMRDRDLVGDPGWGQPVRTNSFSSTIA